MTSIFAGAAAPIIAGSLLAAYSASMPITVYLLIVMAVTACALIAARETRGIDYFAIDRADGEVSLIDAPAPASTTVTPA